MPYLTVSRMQGGDDLLVLNLWESRDGSEAAFDGARLQRAKDGVGAAEMPVEREHDAVEHFELLR